MNPLDSHFNDRPVFRPLTPVMIAALTEAANRFDSAVCADRRTWRALWNRGLVYYDTGRGTDRRGCTTYGVVVGVYLTHAGRACVAKPSIAGTE